MEILKKIPQPEGIELSIQSKSYMARTYFGAVTMASGTLPWRMPEKRSRHFILATCEKVTLGLPSFTISYTNFGIKLGRILAKILYGWLMLPFYIFDNFFAGKPWYSRTLFLEKIDLFVYEKNTIKEDLPFLFEPEFQNKLAKWRKSKLKGTFRYSSLGLTYESLTLPESEEDFKSFNLAMEILSTLRLELSKAKAPNPELALKRAYRTIKKDEICKEIKWSQKEGELPYPIYPKAISDFYGMLSSEYWTDLNYNQKPVQTWLEDPAKLSKLSHEDKKALFAFLVRGERFNEGLWQKALEEGYFDYFLI